MASSERDGRGRSGDQDFPDMRFCLYRDADTEGKSCADHERYRQDDTGGGTLTVQNVPTIVDG